MMGRTSTTLLTLPSEVIESILICSRSPRTVASIAQTCRTLHTLVYASPDSLLWRELFLTTWDDPRPALEHRALVDPRIHPAAWDWGTEYRRRVSADKLLKAWRRDICAADDADFETEVEGDGNTREKNGDHGTCTSGSDWYATTLSTLLTMLDTLLTLSPFPAFPPIALTVLSPAIGSYPTGNAGSGVGDQRERMSNAPPLPPLLIVLASGFDRFEGSRSAARVGRMVHGPHVSKGRAHAPATDPDAGESGRSEVASWTPTSTSIPIPSLPPQLMRTLLASHAANVRGFPAYMPSLSGVDYWGADPLGDVFHRIICITGFVPIPPPLETISDHTLPASVEANSGEDNGVGTPRTGQRLRKRRRQETTDQPTSPFPTPSQQHADARTLARRRVYDMRYLRGDRLWGPFQLVTRASLNPRPGARVLDVDNKAKFLRGEARGSAKETASERRELRGLDTLAWAMGADIELDDVVSTSDDDSGDEEWHDAVEAGPDPSSSSSQSRNRDHEQVTRASEEGTNTEDTSDDVQMNHGELFISRILSAVIPEPVPNSMSAESRPLRRRTRRSNPRLPPNSLVLPRDIKPEHLRPDYTFLASVRIVVEANLRELFGSEISDDVEQTTSDTTVGGVGMFWEDEDEIIRAQHGSSGQRSSCHHASSSPSTPPGNPSTANVRARDFELVDVLSSFQNLEVVRLGSACGYWPAWIEHQHSEVISADDAGASAPSSNAHIGWKKPRTVTQRGQLEQPIEDTSNPVVEEKGKGKGKAKRVGSAVGLSPSTRLGDWEIGPEGETCEGWDWAGVAGIWRRCVCWMDYRELLFFNLDPTKFTTLGTQEACRIIPMELRITGYTRAELMPIYDTERSNVNASTSHRRPKTIVRYFRPPPTIHFSGSSVGSDRGLEDGRSVRGTVQLIGGGEVRWQLDTYTQESTSPGSSTPEWSSEAVQIGGIGSAVGVLGMWTGAGHERADPLGPFWAWKVA